MRRGADKARGRAGSQAAAGRPGPDAAAEDERDWRWLCGPDGEGGGESLPSPTPSTHLPAFQGLACRALQGGTKANGVQQAASEFHGISLERGTRDG